MSNSSIMMNYFYRCLFIRSTKISLDLISRSKPPRISQNIPRGVNYTPSIWGIAGSVFGKFPCSGWGIMCEADKWGYPLPPSTCMSPQDLIRKRGGVQVGCHHTMRLSSTGLHQYSISFACQPALQRGSSNSI